MQLTFSSKDAQKECVMHSKSDNIKFMLYNDAKVVDKLFESLLSRYQDNLEPSIGGSEFMFDSVQLTFYKF